MKLSIITPAWNAEAHIAECLRGVLAVPSDEIEIVVVDDGSSDQTAEVVRQFASPQVKLISHETNQGVMKARETGIRNASGDFVTFLDSDDTIEPGAYQKILQKAVDEDADMVIFGYDEIVDGKSRKGLFKPSVPADKEQRTKDAISLKASPFLWDKVVRRSILDKISFPPENMAEDWAMTVQMMMLSDKVCCIDEALLHYHILNESYSHDKASREKIIERAMSEKANVEFIESLLAERGLEVTYSKEMDARKSNVKRLLFPALGSKDSYATWRNSFPEINWRILGNGLLGAEYKIKHLCAMMGVYSPLHSAFTKLRGR